MSTCYNKWSRLNGLGMRATHSACQRYRVGSATAPNNPGLNGRVSEVGGTPTTNDRPPTTH
eukprot:9069616-Alexandrium_andersonii.AAC.1